MKIVPFYPNQSDNLHCLQSSVKSVLSFFNVDYNENEVDKNTGFFGTMSWSSHSVNWLFEKGLDVKLVSPFEYDKLVSDGENYLKLFKTQGIFEKEKNEGQYANLDKVREASRLMIKNKLWIKERMTIGKLREFLNNDETLAIGKTIYEFLDGNAIAGTSHFVTIIKEYCTGEWLIHDPGLPPVERRKVPQIIADDLQIFGDVILISKKY